MQKTLKQKDVQQEINRLKQQFLQSADFTAREIAWGSSEQAIICYYSSLVKKSEVERYLNLLRLEHKRALRAQSNTKQQDSSSSNENQTSNQNNNNSKQRGQDKKDQSAAPDQNQKTFDETKMNPNKNNYNANNAEQESQTTVLPEDSISITTEQYARKKIVEHVCNGETLIILLQSKEMIRLISPEFVHRPTEEPANEQVLRGSHEGLIEHFDSNVSLIRKRLKNNKLVVKKVVIGKETKTEAYYFYVDNLVDKEALKTVEERLNSINLDMYYSLGQLSDQLDDSVMSPFPQLLNTERPDRVVANILEGKIAVMTDNSPTAIIGPVSFFSFYQSPDDFNSRVLIGSFYSILRFFSIVMAIYLPAFYIAVISFHSEVLPLELANKVKADINQIPYPPFIEALIMILTLELIREASVRLPKSIGQTIGVVGGLVIGDAIVKAGLVSNLMVIVVAFTAISSFVIPSIELNTTIRVIGFPIMILASFFGFFGIMIGTFVLIIHLMNLSSFNQPYLSPIIPFNPKAIKKVFFRVPYYKANKQATSFSPKKGEKT
jgi:spore germination protein KA